jgi:hypothetical protein
MKKINDIFLIFIAVLLLSGCEGYLDIKPVGRVIPETAEDYRKLLNNAYSSFPDDFSKIVFATDQYHLLKNAGDYEIYKNYITWDYKGESNSLPLNWRLYYKVIFECNDIIEKHQEIKDGRKEEIQQLVGEAYALRGYTHFILANLYAPAYGKVDAKDTPAIPLRLDTKTDVIPKQNTLEQVYTQVIADLQKATELMTEETWMGSDKYRLSKAATFGLLSRVYLYMEEWQSSVDMGNKALDFSDELADLNLTAEVPNHYLQPENLWSIHYGVNSTALTFLKVHNKLTDYFTVNAGDLRASVCFENNGDMLQVGKVGSNELRVGMRTAEIYLNMAEAYCELADTERAKGYLLTLIANRYTSNAAENKVFELEKYSNQELLEEVYLQRNIELSFEGHRWFDLRRTKQPEIIHSIGDDIYTLTDKNKYTFPIPQEALDGNSNLQ